MVTDPKEPGDRLEALIAELPPRRAPDGWRDRVLAAIDAGTPPSEVAAAPDTPVAPPRRTPWWAAGTVVAAAAALVIYLRTQHSSTEPIASNEPHPEMTWKSAVAMRGDAATIGDVVTIPATGEAELRVYLDEMLLKQCPGDPACTPGNGITLTVDRPGLLTAIAFRRALSSGPTSSRTRDRAAAITEQITTIEIAGRRVY